MSLSRSLGVPSSSRTADRNGKRIAEFAFAARTGANVGVNYGGCRGGESVAVAGEAVNPNRALAKLKAYARAGVTLSKDPYSVRFLPRWIRTIHSPSTPQRNRFPWMVFKAVRWLDSYLNSEMNVFEYGTGGSTVFVARRGR